MNHLETDPISACSYFHIHHKENKNILLCAKPGNPQIIQSVEVIPTSVIRSFLSNAEVGPSLRLYRTLPWSQAARTHTRGKALLPGTSGWCGATSAWHSHKRKPLALSDCTWLNTKHTNTLYQLKMALFGSQGLAKVQSKNVLTLLSKYLF